MPTEDRRAYMREYMRQRRAKEKASVNPSIATQTPLNNKLMSPYLTKNKPSENPIQPQSKAIEEEYNEGPHSLWQDLGSLIFYGGIMLIGGIIGHHKYKSSQHEPAPNQ